MILRECLNPECRCSFSMEGRDKCPVCQAASKPMLEKYLEQEANQRLVSCDNPECPVEQFDSNLYATCPECHDEEPEPYTD